MSSTAPSTENISFLPIFYFSIISLSFYLINTGVLYIILDVKAPQDFLLPLIFSTALIWFFILLTDFLPHFINKRSLYDHFDNFFRRFQRIGKLFSNMLIFLGATPGSPIKYFTLAFIISILLSIISSAIVKIAILQAFFALIYIAFIIFLANLPAYFLSRTLFRQNYDSDQN